MIETKRKTRGIEFLRELEEFVREREFPRRVTDSVVELRKELEIEETSAGAEELLLQIPGLMNHIGRKYRADTPQEPEFLEDNIRLEDVRERVEEILKLFEDSNGPLEEQYINGQILAKSELENGIREILHTDVYYDSLRDGGSFCSYMAGVEQVYGITINRLLQSCAEDLFQNCDRMAARIKSLFNHIKDDRLRVTQRDLYQQYDSKYDILKQKIFAKAVQQSGEQGIVSQWAAGCVQPMEKIKKKIHRKKYVMILFPLIFALIAIPAFKFVMNNDFNRSGNHTAMETVEETGNTTVSHAIEEEIKQRFQEHTEEGGKKKSGSGDVSHIVLYIIGTAYVLYAVHIVKKSRQWYSEAAGGFLATEVERFLKDDEIQKNTQQKFTDIRTEMEKEWKNMIHELLTGGRYQEHVQTNSEAQQFLALIKEWEMIRRLA